MRSKLILLCCLALPFVTGCDFFRAVAGRPTSKDLAAAVAAMQEHEAALLKAREDSLARAKALADSLALRDSLEAAALLESRKGYIFTPERFSGLAGEVPESPCYVIVGSYNSVTHAEKKRLKCMQKGFDATVITFRRGLSSVGICPSDSPVEALRALDSLKGNDICPPSAWILVTR